MTELENINDTIMSLNENDLHRVTLHRNITSILTATIKFIKDSEKFDQPFF